MNPSLNLEDAPFGNFILKYLPGTEFKENVSWGSFIILDIIAIIYCIKKIKNKPLKIALVIFLMVYLNYLIVFPLMILNNMYLKLTLPGNPPFIENINGVFPQNKILEDNFSVYKNEMLAFMDSQSEIDCFHTKTPGVTVAKTGDKCWRSVHIKTIKSFVPGFEQICPELYKILNTPMVYNAFLSILDPGVNIPKHVGYSRMYLRYHLGVEIPEVKEKPFIICGGQKYTWKEGKGVIFDDMYQHYVENPTDYRRIVLFVDLIRPELMNDWVTNFLLDIMSKNIFIKNYNKNQHNSKKN